MDGPWIKKGEMLTASLPLRPIEPILCNQINAKHPVIAYAKRVYMQLRMQIRLFPFYKTVPFSIDPLSGIFVIQVRMPNSNPQFDQVRIINATPFRIISASGNTVVWAGGTPPFTAWVQHGTKPGTFVNVDLATYTITKDQPRQFLVLTAHQAELIDDDYDWWAADDELVNGQAKQTSVGVMIEDRSVPPQRLFAPFGGLTRGDIVVYEHFGPQTWCVPIVPWKKDAQTGVRYPYWTFYNVDVEIPGAVNEFLPGTFSHFAGDVPYDAGVPVPPGAHVMKSVFTAADAIHYHPAEDTYECTIAMGLQSISQVTAQRIYAARPDYTNYAYVGDVWRLSITYSNPSCNPLVKTATGASLNGNDATITSSGQVTVDCSIAGNSYYESASYHYVLVANAIQPLSQHITVSFDPPVYQVGESTTVSAASDKELTNFTYLLQNDAAHMGDIVGNMVTFRKASINGSVLIVRVTEAGTNLVLPGLTDTALTVAKGDPVVGFLPETGDLSTIIYGDTLAGKLNAHAKWPNEVTQLVGTFLFYQIEEGSNPIKKMGEPITEADILKRDPYYTDGMRTILCEFTPTGADADNWNIGTSINYIHIERKNITVTADYITKTYGDADPALTYDAPGLVGTDSLTGSLARAAGENAGTYAINIGTLAADDNYTVDFTAADLTITPKTLLITADNKVKTYGSADPPLTYAVTGLVGSDQVSGSLSRTPGEAVGSYSINMGTLAAGDNYSISFYAGTLTITAQPVSYSFQAQGNFANARVNFLGGSGTGWTVSWYGSFTQMEVRLNAGVSTSSYMYLYSFGTSPCYQASGYYKIADNSDPNNYVILYYSGWFPNISNISPPLHACTVASGLQGTWTAHIQINEYYAISSITFADDATSGMCLRYLNYYGGESSIDAPYTYNSSTRVVSISAIWDWPAMTLTISSDGTYAISNQGDTYVRS